MNKSQSNFLANIITNTCMSDLSVCKCQTHWSGHPSYRVANRWWKVTKRKAHEGQISHPGHHIAPYIDNIDSLLLNYVTRVLQDPCQTAAHLRNIFAVLLCFNVLRLKFKCIKYLQVSKLRISVFQDLYVYRLSHKKPKPACLSWDNNYLLSLTCTYYYLQVFYMADL